MGSLGSAPGGVLAAKGFFWRGRFFGAGWVFPFCPSVFPPSLSSFRRGPTARGRGGGRLRIMTSI